MRRSRLGDRFGCRAAHKSAKWNGGPSPRSETRSQIQTNKLLGSFLVVLVVVDFSQRVFHRFFIIPGLEFYVFKVRDKFKVLIDGRVEVSHFFRRSQFSTTFTLLPG